MATARRWMRSPPREKVAALALAAVPPRSTPPAPTCPWGLARCDFSRAPCACCTHGGGRMESGRHPDMEFGGAGIRFPGRTKASIGTQQCAPLPKSAGPDWARHYSGPAQTAASAARLTRRRPHCPLASSTARRRRAVKHSATAPRFTCGPLHPVPTARLQNDKMRQRARHSHPEYSNSPCSPWMMSFFWPGGAASTLPTTWASTPNDLEIAMMASAASASV